MPIWHQWPFRLLRSGERLAPAHGHAVWDSWPGRGQAALRACQVLGGQVRELKIAQPATEKELRHVERALGMPIPTSFRSVLGSFSACFSLHWFLPDDVSLPDNLRGIFSANCQWDISQLVALERERLKWVENCFPDPEDAYDRVWHHKMPFLGVGNGDMLALDLTSSPEHPVVYLSHDDSSIHGYLLGTSFVDFVDRWTLLGCPGAEDWQLIPFIQSPDQGIDPCCPAAEQWRAWFGLTIP